MSTIGLSEELRQLFDEIIHMSGTVVRNQYIILQKLEQEGKGDSDEYRLHVEYLKMAREVETNIFNKLKFEDGVRLIEHMTTRSKIKNTYVIEDMINGREMNPVGKRILTHLENIITPIVEIRLKYANGSTYVYSPKPNNKDLELYGDTPLSNGMTVAEYQKVLENKMIESREMEQAFKCENATTFLHAIQKYIDSCDNIEFRDKLKIDDERYNLFREWFIAMKYHILYTNKVIEPIIFNADFRSAREITISSSFLSIMGKENAEEKHDYYNEYFNNPIILQQLDDISMFNPKDLSDDGAVIRTMVQMTYLRSAVSLFDEDSLENLRDGIIDIIEKDEQVTRKIVVVNGKRRIITIKPHRGAETTLGMKLSCDTINNALSDKKTNISKLWKEFP